MLSKLVPASSLTSAVSPTALLRFQAVFPVLYLLVVSFQETIQITSPEERCSKNKKAYIETDLTCNSLILASGTSFSNVHVKLTYQ